MDVYCRLEEGVPDPGSMLPIYRHRSLYFYGIAPSVTLDSYTSKHHYNFNPNR
jgi:hypothetical protein